MATPTDPPRQDAAGATPHPPAPDRETPDPVPAETEILRLRAEVSALQARLDTRRRRRLAVLALRRTVAAVLVALSAFGTVASVVGLWAASTTLNTDRWVATVAPLPQNPQVSAAVAQYATTELFRVLDVEQRLRVVLPEQAAFVAGPLTAQLREVIQQTVTKVLRSDRFQAVWVELNRRAHARAVAIVEDRSTIVSTGDDRVEIDLLPLINQVLRDLSAQLPTLFGRRITLPDVTSGEIPADLRTRVAEALGVPLPDDLARFTVYDAGRLRAVQRAVAEFKRDLALLVIGTVVLLGLALFVAAERRRTVLQFGIWLMVAAVAVTAVLRTARADLLRQVSDGVYRDGVAAALTTIAATLRERGEQLIWIGAILALLAYLIGPGRVPVWLRGRVRRAAGAGGRWTGAGARELLSSASALPARHLDAVRVAGAVVAAVLALVLSSWTALLVLIVVLAVFELAVTLSGRSARPVPAPAPPPAPTATPTHR